MQNFVFKTRNPEYIWHLIAIFIIIAFIPSPFYGWKYLGFMISYGVYVPILLGGVMANFIATIEIAINKNEIAITKYILGIVSYKYQQQFEYYHIENQWAIRFAGYHLTPLRFELTEEDFEISSYFAVYIQSKKVIIGNEKDFEKFKEKLEEWNNM